MAGTPIRFELARLLCNWMPPLLAQRARTLIYPLARARRDDFPFTSRACTGAKYTGRSRDYHGYRFGVHGYFDWRNVAIALACCGEGDTIVEVGANVGTETVAYRDIVGARGRVFAFEPFPNHVRTLRNLVALNGWSNVEILPVALCDRNGSTTFVPPPDDHATGVGHLAGRNGVKSASDQAMITVQCQTLDSCREVIGKVHALFCDTEGAELMVLRGAGEILREHQPVVVLEASPKLLDRFGANVEELHAVLRQAGYAAFSIGRWGVSAVETSAAIRHGNWLCLPAAKTALARTCQQMLRRCGIMPCVSGLNPLRR